jgi:hypothetical protein
LLIVVNPFSLRAACRTACGFDLILCLRIDVAFVAVLIALKLRLAEGSGMLRPSAGAVAASVGGV